MIRKSGRGSDEKSCNQLRPSFCNYFMLFEPMSHSEKLKSTISALWESFIISKSYELHFGIGQSNLYLPLTAKSSLVFESCCNFYALVQALQQKAETAYYVCCIKLIVSAGGLALLKAQQLQDLSSSHFIVPMQRTRQHPYLPRLFSELFKPFRVKTE